MSNVLYFSENNTLMDIKDIFSDIKDRLTNPFTSSFIIAWLINNYPVTVGILFYKQQDLKRDGYSSYLDLIHKHSNWFHMLVLPFLAALFYTFIFPYFKSVIILHRAKVNLTESNNLKTVQGTALIPLDDHLKIQQSLVDKLDIINKLTITQSESINEITSLRTEKIDLVINNRNFKNEIEYNKSKESQRQYFSKNSFLSGKWKVSGTEGEDLIVWEFLNSNVVINSKIYSIKNIVSDPISNRISFMLSDTNKKESERIDIFYLFEVTTKYESLIQRNLAVNFTLNKLV